MCIRRMYSFVLGLCFTYRNSAPATKTTRVFSLLPLRSRKICRPISKTAWRGSQWRKGDTDRMRFGPSPIRQRRRYFMYSEVYPLKGVPAAPGDRVFGGKVLPSHFPVPAIMGHSPHAPSSANTTTALGTRYGVNIIPSYGFTQVSFPDPLR